MVRKTAPKPVRSKMKASAPVDLAKMKPGDKLLGTGDPKVLLTGGVVSPKIVGRMGPAPQNTYKTEEPPPAPDFIPGPVATVAPTKLVAKGAFEVIDSKTGLPKVVVEPDPMAEDKPTPPVPEPPSKFKHVELAKRIAAAIVDIHREEGMKPDWKVLSAAMALCRTRIQFDWSKFVKSSMDGG